MLQSAMHPPDWISGMSNEQLSQFVTESGQLLNRYCKENKPDAAGLVRRLMITVWKEQLQRRQSCQSSPFSNYS